jgi:triacylglycerol lipase
MTNFLPPRLLAACIVSMSALCAFTAHAACLDNVVMVHGNTTDPSTWDKTVAALKERGYVDGQIFRPSWGSKSCAACNSHAPIELAPVKKALQSALATSCTKKIDVIGHSMGVTLAMKAINDLRLADKVNSFIGIAGAQHGLNACGTFPMAYPNATCGAFGLSVNSPLVKSVQGKRYGAKMYSIKSTDDTLVCNQGCDVKGSHTSNIDMQNGTFDYPLGHFELQTETAGRQAELVMNAP